MNHWLLLMFVKFVILSHTFFFVHNQQPTVNSIAVRCSCKKMVTNHFQTYTHDFLNFRLQSQVIISVIIFVVVFVDGVLVRRIHQFIIFWTTKAMRKCHMTYFSRNRTKPIKYL